MLPSLLLLLTPLARAAPCPDTWGMEQVGADWAWARTDQRGIDAPLVAVLDGGFFAGHLDLAGRVDGGFDWVTGVEALTVPTLHEPDRGTWVAGLIVGADNEDIAGVGVMPEGRVVLAQVGDATGSISFTAIVAALDAISAGAAGDVGVVVTPASTNSSSRALGEAIGALEAADVVVVLPAGDCDGCDQPDLDQAPLYPAAYQGPNLLKVAASDPDDGLWSGSRFGLRAVDLAAPGTELCAAGALGPSEIATESGTAGAAALAAGVAGLVRAVYPALTAAEVVTLLRASAVRVDGLEGRVRTGGRIDADRAFQAAIPRLDPPTTAGAELTIPVQNLGPAGTVTVLLHHHDELWVDALLEPADFSVEALQPGDTVTGFGGLPVTLTQPATRLTGDLPDAGSVTLRLAIGGTAPGEGSVRVGATSPGAAWLPAPIEGDTVDPSGAPAWSVDLDPAPPDTAPPAVDGTIAQPEGCTCASAPGPVAGLLAALAALVAGRRRRSG